MKSLNLFKIFLIFFFNSILLSSALGNISSSIIVKVGSEIITNSDLENEVNTFLVLTKRQINQSNIDKVKNGVLKSLIQISIKKMESFSSMIKAKNIFVAIQIKTNPS